jgi:glutaconate CoA-transferase subunit B
VISIHPGVTREQIDGNTGWKVRYSPDVAATPAPDPHELAALREIHARTRRAHGDQA